jgi:pimeloyl-ACP methyl ester carboxylesterase
MAAAGPLFALAATAVRGANAVGLRRRQLAPLDLESLDRQARIALQSPAAEAEFIRQYSSTRADLRSFRSAHYLQELVELFRPLPPPASYAQPMLVLLSTGATFAALAATRSIAAGFPHGRVQTIDCHHWPLTERPVEVRQAIEGFVAPHIGPYPAATPALR